MWLQIELPQAAMVTEIQFDSESGVARGGGAGRGRGAAPGAGPAAAGPGPNPVTLMPSSSPQSGGFNATGGYPRGYQVQVSMDGTTWSAPVAEGKGTGRSTVISFAPGAGEVRADHPDRNSRQRAAVGGDAPARLRGWSRRAQVNRVQATRPLLRPEGAKGINSGGASRRQVAGGECRQRQADTDCDERHRISRRQPV